jgi:EmrB/QacA subfamily drug resistance transporter
VTSANSTGVGDGVGADPRRWWMLGFLSTAMTIAMIDATILNVAVPQIGTELGARPSDVQWFNAMYSLVFAALLISMGRVGDRVGHRRMFTAGVMTFVGASVVAALAVSPTMLIAARAGQGVGAAMFVPATLAMVTMRFTGKERGTAFAIWGMVIGVVAAIGPLVGGFLIEVASWRWAFAINVPIAVVAIAGLWWSTGRDRPSADAAGIDPFGAALVTATVGLLVFGLIQGGPYGWWTPTLGPGSAAWWPLTSVSVVPFAFLGAAALGVAFVAWERQRTSRHRPVVLDLELFTIPAFTAGTIAGLVIMFGEFGMILTLPLFLQNVLGYTALQAGACIAIVTAGGLTGALVSAPLVRRIGAWPVVRLGLAGEAIGMVGLAVSYGPDATPLSLGAWLVVFGLGIGFTNAQLLNVTLAPVPRASAGQASGTQSTTRQIGTALGVAVLGAVLWASFGQGLGELGDQQSAVRELVESSSGAALGSPDFDRPNVDVAFDPATGQTARQVFSDAVATSTLVGAGFVALALLAVSRVREPTTPVSEVRSVSEAAAP